MINRLKTLVVQAGFIGGLAVALAACQTTSPYTGQGEIKPKGPQPNFPTHLDTPAANTPDTQVIATSPPPPAAAPATPPPPAPRPSSTVDSQPLPPLTSAAPAAQPAPAPAPAQPFVAFPATTAAPAPAAAAAPAPPPPAAPTYREIATGPVIETEGAPTTHVVKKGDTLSSISREMDISVKDLQERNKLGGKSTIHPGQKLKGPSAKVKAYVVQPGDTLSSIARRFSVTNAQLTRANGLGASGAIRPNQHLVLPSGYHDTGPQRIEVAAGSPPPPPPPSIPAAPARTAAAPPPAAPPSAPPAAAGTTTTVTTTTTTAAAPPPARPAPTAPASSGSGGDFLAAGRGKFIWPIDGRTIGRFGENGPSQQSNGLSIAAAEGTEVKASAAGTVTYVGLLNEDVGNIILIDNGNGFFTAYAHLSRMDVKINDVVRQGQTVGLVGHTGAATEPQLYFEMRHRDSPRVLASTFDPMLLLPRR